MTCYLQCCFGVSNSEPVAYIQAASLKETCSWHSQSWSVWDKSLFQSLYNTRLLRLVKAFPKKVGLLISTKANLAVCVLIIFFNMLNCHLTQISPPFCLSPPPLSRLKHPIPINDRPIIYLPFCRNVFSPDRLLEMNLKECYKFTTKYILLNTCLSAFYINLTGINLIF